MPLPGPETCHIRLAPGPAGRMAVRVEGRRLGPVRGLFAGRPSAEAPALARRLFPVCGAAQEIATARAIEAAQDRRAPKGVVAARARMLTAEAGFAHVWRAAIDWPRLLGRPPQVGAAKAARAALARLEQGMNARAAGELADLLEDATLFTPVEMALKARLDPCLWSSLDAPLGPRPAAWFARHLATTPSFAIQPEVAGAPADPLPGLSKGARLADRLDALREAARGLARALRDGPAPEAETTLHRPGRDTGCGVAQTARGPLACLVRLDAGCVAEMRVIAPTEWVMHPQGALARALGLLTGPDTRARAQALVALFDPCAELRLEMPEAAHA